MTQAEYKKISIAEFSKAAEVYETNQAGVYRMCKKDYPDVLAEPDKRYTISVASMVEKALTAVFAISVSSCALSTVSVIRITCMGACAC